MLIDTVRVSDMFYAMCIWGCIYCLIQSTLLIRCLLLHRERLRHYPVYVSCWASALFVLFISLIYLVAEFRWIFKEYSEFIGFDDYLWAVVETGYLVSTGYTTGIVRRILS